MTRKEKIKKLLGRERYVELAYLFGSAARGELGKLSDVDVAVYLDESLSSEERFKLQLRLMGELASVLQTNRVDLIVMNEAPLPLQFEIIKSNRPILTRPEFDRVEFEHAIMSRYLDRRYHDERSADEFMRKVSKEGLA
ncbi:MAG: nucleotidyltransferase domain-containing protein [Candidatus Hadarchaeaceae archaeon]